MSAVGCSADLPPVGRECLQMTHITARCCDHLFAAQGIMRASVLSPNTT